MRASSLTNLGVGVDYNISSDYDKVLVVAGLASEIEELAPHANEIANLVANLPDVLTVQEASELVNNLTVKVTTLPAGSTATSDLVGTEIRLGIPAGTQGVQGLQGPKGDKGDKGDIGLTGSQGPIGLTGPQGPRGLRGNDGVDGAGVEITSILNNPNKSITINFSDGTQHTTDPLKGQDGTSVTVTNVVNNPNGTMQINFSDGASHTTANLIGPRGFKGDTGDHLHHISYQRSKDALGNEVGPVAPSQRGYTDTYAMWLSQEELPEMYIGEFTVYNGLNALTAEEQYKFESIEFGATGDQTASEILTLLKTVDGSGSGIDADLLDGQEGAYYLNASNINTGTINDSYLPNTITSDITGNAATATKLSTSRTISLTGDVTGNVSFDGSANVSITATVADDSHNHVLSNVDGLQVALDSKVDKVSKQSLDSNSALRVSGTTVSLYKGDGTFDSITTQDTVYTHPNSGVTAGTYSKVTVNTQGHITAGESLSESDIPSLDASKITSGTIDSARLPSFVDDILEFVNLAGFPATGEAGKIYIALDTNKTYRWSGSTYVYITSGAVDSVAGKTGVITLVKADVGLSNVDNTSDINKPISTATQTVIDTKVDKVVGKQLSTEDYTTAEKTKLSGIAAGAQVNVPTDLSLGTATGTTIPLNSSTGTDVVLPAATTTTAGLITSADKTKLDGIATGANNYVLPNASSIGIGGVKVSATAQTVAANAVTATASRTYAVQLDASGNALVNVPWVDTNIVYTHPTSGVTAGTYKSVTVDANGHVTGGTNPTTLVGYGITDAYTKTEVDSLIPDMSTKQDVLVSATNIKTINGESILGSGDLVISGGGHGGNVDLSEYYKKTETYSKVEVDTIISSIPETDLSNYYDKTEVDAIALDKVDKVSGKQLSTEDYTTADKNKLTGLSNYTKPASEPISYITGLQTALDSKVSKNGVEVLHLTDALRISGTTLSLYKGDGTFESVVTQDTVYTLPKASPTVLGGIKVGTNLSIDENGVLSANDTNVSFTEISTKPTTISGYGITDAYTKTEVGTLAEFTTNLG